jgi:hypothetical protein
MGQKEIGDLWHDLFFHAHVLHHARSGFKAKETSSAKMHNFAGVWVTPSRQHVYRVVPKCACSTIGQALYYLDAGQYFDGDIHDAREGVLKWNDPAARSAIQEAMTQGQAHRFTCVRNPYTRILSAFFDKICGIQRNGRRYRGNLVPLLMEQYGVEVGSETDINDFDQVKSFRRFLLFVRDTVQHRRPIEPDIHWAPMADHIGFTLSQGGRMDQILRVEQFAAGLQSALDARPRTHPLEVGAMPRFNESAAHGPKQAHPTEAYFDDISSYIMNDVYGRDFAFFGYDITTPQLKAATAEIDLELLHSHFTPHG